MENVVSLNRFERHSPADKVDLLRRAVEGLAIVRPGKPIDMSVDDARLIFDYIDTLRNENARLKG